ncbi:MAG: cation:proton antiporter [Oligoflexales bacterium]|nr:cation:proton antiporter [Oligoflexales bacterium]
MPNFLYEIFILAGVVTAVVTICHSLKIPAIVGFLISGVLIGPHGFKLVSTLPSAYNLTEIAGIILMFTIGLEFSISRLKSLRQQFFRLGMSQVILTILVVIAAGTLLLPNYPINKLIAWGLMISLSSTALVLKLLHDYRETNVPHGKNSLGILLFQDIAVIPMMLLLPLLAKDSLQLGTIELTEVLYWVAKIAAVLATVFFTSKVILPFVLEVVIKTRSQELFIFCIIFICLGIGYLFHLVGLSLTIGAFVAGALISESAFGHQTMSIFGALRDTFLGMFFATIGMLLDFGFIIDNANSVFALGFSLFLLKMLIVLIICLIDRIPLPIALITAFAVCQIGEFSFLIASRGVELKLFNANDNQYFLAVSVLSMVFTPMLYIFAPKLAFSKPVLFWRNLGGEKVVAAVKKNIRTNINQDEKNLLLEQNSIQNRESTHLEAKDKKPHTLVIGYGIAGRNIAAALDSLAVPYSILEMNYDVVKKNLNLGIPIFFGDAARADVLRHAGLEHARLVVIATSGSHSIPHIIQAIRHIRPDIEIVVRLQYVAETHILKLDPKIHLVIAEIETASEMVAFVLKSYGVDNDTIFEFTVKAKTQLNMMAELSSGLRYQITQTPGWNALASMRPFVIDKSYFANGKTLAELALPKFTGASIASIYREGVGTTVPTADLTIHPRDVIVVVGSNESFELVEKVLKLGNT